MRWLIDGYNVVRRDADLGGAEAESLQAGRAALLARVAEVARRSSDRFTVVFDGAPSSGPAAQPGRLEVLFSRPPEKADDVLMRLARKEGNGAVVVSSDRKIQDAANRAGCTVLGSEAFLDALVPGRTEDTKDGDEDDEDVGPATKRGNPRRLSKEARAVQRALRRLRASREGPEPR
jgi:predicted RNA-binding protein with PIN domain